jgi:hypothetical protein
MDEASRTKSELRQLRQQHEELLLSSREAASRADVANSQLMGELKLKGFELTRLQVSKEQHAHGLLSHSQRAMYATLSMHAVSVCCLLTTCVLTCPLHAWQG